MTSCPLDPRTPVFVPAGSTTHAHARARWIPARLCSCPMDPHTPVSMRDGSTHARIHRVPTRVGSQGPRACSLAGSPYTHTLGPCTRARTRSPHLLARRVPHARLLVGSPYHTHWAHARALTPGPHACSLAGSPSALTCGVSIPHAPGLCTHTRTRSPRAFTRRVPTHACSRGLHTCTLRAHAHALARRVSMHVYMCLLDASCVHPSAVCIGRVICSSSSTVL